MSNTGNQVVSIRKQEGTTKETEVVALSTIKHVKKVEKSPHHPDDAGSPITFIGVVLGVLSGNAAVVASMGPGMYPTHLGDNFLSFIIASVIGGIVGGIGIRKFDDHAMTVETIHNELIELGFPAKEVNKMRLKGLSRRKEQRRILTNPETGLEVVLVNNREGAWLEKNSHRPALDAWDDSMKSIGILYALPPHRKISA